MKMREDRRTKYTENVIHQSFLELLKSKPLSEISVKDLCASADVNRGTFYHHYEDIYDLFEKLEIGYAKEIITHMQHPHSVFDFQFEGFLVKTLRFFRERPDISLVILNPASKGKGMQMIIQQEKEHWASAWRSIGSVTEQESEWLLTFLSSGFISCFTAWYQSGFAWDEKQLAKTLTQLVAGGLNAFRRPEGGA